MHVYVYLAGLLCEDCANKLMRELPKPKYEQPWDSNDYPAGPYEDGGGEADSPQHCVSCGEFLENPLTEDGRRFVRAVFKNAKNYPGLYRHEVLSQWAEFYEVSLEN